MVVNRSSLPALLPMSLMAGVIRPMIIRGIRNWRKWLKMLLNVANTLTAGNGSTSPNPIPRAMAMMMRASNGNFFNFFIDASVLGNKDTQIFLY